MYEFNHATPVTVVLRARGGTVDITAEERDTVQVDVQRMDGGEVSAEQVRVLLEEDTLVVQALGADSWNWRRTPKLRITARVPLGSSLSGKSAAAAVRLGGVFSVVQLNVASAAVHLDEATGDVSLDAASGDLSVDRVGGSLRIKSSSGALRVGDVIGDVNADTASGRIQLGDIGGSARVSTASGDVEIARLRQGTASLRSASGDIEVGVAAGTSVWMDVNTASGKSITDLTAYGDVPPADGPVELELRVRTASGDIRVRRVAASKLPA